MKTNKYHRINIDYACLCKVCIIPQQGEKASCIVNLILFFFFSKQWSKAKFSCWDNCPNDNQRGIQESLVQTYCSVAGVNAYVHIQINITTIFFLICIYLGPRAQQHLPPHLHRLLLLYPPLHPRRLLRAHILQTLPLPLWRQLLLDS